MSMGTDHVPGQQQENSGASSSASSTAQGLSGSGSGAGIGGAKYHAGRGAHSHFQSSSRALANASASGSNDGSTGFDDEEELAHRHPQSSSRALALRQQISPSAQFQRRFADAFNNTKQPMLVGAHGCEASSHTRPSLELSRSISTATGPPSTSTTVPSSPHIQDASGRQEMRSRSLSTTSASRRVDPEVVEAVQPPPTKRRAASTSKGIRIPTAQMKNASKRKVRQSRPSRVIALSYSVCFELLSASQDVLGATASAKLAIGLWKRLLDVDLLPDGRSYDCVIACLLNAERSELLSQVGLSALPEKLPLTSADLTAQIASGSQNVAADQHYSLAWSLTCAAHAAGHAAPWQSFLELAALRGDVQKCERLLEMGRPAAKDAREHARAYAPLLHSIVAAQALIEEPSDAQRQAPTQHLLRVFQQAQSQVDTDIKADKHPNNLFDALVRAHFAASDAPGAVALLSQTLPPDGSSAQDLKGDAAKHQIKVASARVSNLVLGFVHSGDVASACSWYEQHASLTKGDHQSARGHLSKPSLYELSKLIVDTLKQDDPEAYTRDAQQTLRPLLIANVAAEAVFNGHDNSRLSLQQAPEALATLLHLMILNAATAKALSAGEEREHATQLLERNIALVPLVSEPKRLGARDYVEDQGAEKFVQAVLQTVDGLAATGRSTDAASTLTWIARRGPRLQDGHLGAFDEQTRSKLQGAALQILNSADASPVVLLDCACRYIFTATFASVADLWSNDELVKRFTELFRLSRHNLPTAWTEGLTLTELKCLQEAFAIEEERLRPQDLNAFKEDGLGMLWISLLAKSQHASALVGRVQTIAAQRHGEAGRQFAQSIDPSPSAAQPAASAASAPESATPLDTAGSESSHDQLRSPVSTAPTSVLEHSNAEEGSDAAPHSMLPPPVLAPLPVRPLPEVQMIDLDKSARIHDTLSSVKNPSRRHEACDRAWTNVTESLSQVGSYIDIPPMELLIDDAGRRGKLDRLWELYSMGSVLVQSIGGDQKWQVESWYRLENAVMAALAHAGETDAASIFRHRIINAGRVPDASAYGALIANINDTTDDALVAQELFAESQRLGCVPSAYLYTATISKLARARKAELALQLFHEMQEPGRDLKPTVVTIGSVINACVRTGDIANAERIFAILEGDANGRSRRYSLRPPPFNTLIQYFVNNGDREKALLYYEKMQRLRVQPSEHTYKLLLDTFGLLQPPMLQEMESIFNQLVMDQDAQVNGTHWASLINAYGAADVDRAIAVFESIARHPSTLARTSWQAGVHYKPSTAMPDSVAYEALLGVLLQHGRVDLVQQYIDRMRADASVGLTAYVANLVIRAFSSEGTSEGLARARAVFNEMRDPPVGMAAIGNHPMGHRQHHAGAGPSDGISHEPTPAEVARASQHHLAHAMRDVQKEPSTWLELIRAEVAAGQKAEAARLADRMAERGYPAALVMRGRELLSPMTEPDASAPQPVAAAA
ncbi:FOG: PPR repeat [Ceraceosorus bombacis]|uniref:FOG: PPR repeat n=1 Tax=Ceraceosorus bombacis TaxID=401625 RepID=A0A0P1BGP8_9BASI|nr:FOG: PPR repeat [Ceraceosorus bombacis]